MEVAVKNPDVSFQRSLIGRKLGRYEILAKIASGGMASVYVARAQGVAGFERLTAIKVLHANLAHEEDFVKMFLDEARLAARIRHPNVVGTLDISDTLDAGYYLVMEYIEGDHLGKLLSGTTKAGVRLDLPVVLRILTDVLNGLNAAHNLTDDDGKKLNLVHRDISPHNIMVGVDGIARLTDFGIAKAEDRLSHTRDGQIKGKLGYMAPEHASKGISDARSDLFSVGIILWECLTYKRLFRAETAAESLRKLLLEPIPLPSSVHKDYEPFDEILGKALSRVPDERFQNADEFSEALEAAAANCGGTASLRKVGKIVQKYASSRIEREKALIKESISSIRTANELNDNLPQSSDDSVSEASIKSVSKSSTSLRSLPSVSTASLRSGVRPLTSEPEMLEDGLSSAKYFGDQASVLSSVAESVPSGSSRTKWFVAIAVVWCIVLAAIALYTMWGNTPQSLRVIEISPSKEPAETSPAAATNPEGIDLGDVPMQSKDQASKNATDSISPANTPSADRAGYEVWKKQTIEPPGDARSRASTTKGKGKKESNAIADKGAKKPRRIANKKASRIRTRKKKSPTKNTQTAREKTPKEIPKETQKENPKDTPKRIPVDELPAFNPYLNTR